jgi:hypothetical protein
MKLSKKKLEHFGEHYSEWKTWVQDPKQNHFFFFCENHIPMVMRKGIDSESVKTSEHVCDFPGCVAPSNSEYFPNLVKVLAEGEEDIKNNRLYEMNDKGDFVKVKNYGKRVQSKAISKKRSKKA